MFTFRRCGLALAAAVASTSAITVPAQAVTWTEAVTASAPAYWYRFEGTTTAAGAPNLGSAGAGFNGTYGAGFTNGDLGKASAYSGLGNAIEFTGPNASAATNKIVQFGAAIPELVNRRVAPENKTTTVEYWIQTTQVGSNGGNNWQNPSLLATESPGDGDMYWGNFPNNTTGQFRFSTSDINEITVRDVANGQWQHVVMVKDWQNAGTTTSTLYINGGSLAGGRTISVTTPSGGTSQQDDDSFIDRLGVTKAGELGNVQYQGKVDELAIYNRGLTAAEVAAHYTAVAGSLVGLYRFDNAANVGIDSGIRGNNLITQGDAQQTAAGKFGGGLLLDGNGDMLVVNAAQIAPVGLSVGDGSYAISAQFKPAVSNNGGIVGWGNYGTTNEVTALRMNGANGMVHYWWAIDQVPGGLNLLDGQFHHVVAMYDTTTGLRSLLLDGVLISQDSPPDHNAAGINFTLGKTFSNEFFNGILDDVAIFNRALTAGEIAAISRGDFSAFITAAVPEPTTGLLALLSVGALALRRRGRAV
jgi:hypothetical protein